MSTYTINPYMYKIFKRICIIKGIENVRPKYVERMIQRIPKNNKKFSPISLISLPKFNMKENK